MTPRIIPLGTGVDLGVFDCGQQDYNDWLVHSAGRAEQAGTAKVYLLMDEPARVLGYFAICPTAVARAGLPGAASRNAPDPVPGYLLAKLALDRSLQRDRTMQWGTQLVLGALRRIVGAAEVGGGRVIVVDADNEGLVSWYRRHSFLPTRGSDLRLYMKVATARSQIEAYDALTDS